MENRDVQIRLEVNSIKHHLLVRQSDMLLDVLRNDLGLTGVKRGCDSGQCGACSVLVDGRLVSSCITPVVHADGKSITTIEGLSGEGGQGLHPIQQAFVDEGAVQCGFCTPGMVLSAKALLDVNNCPTEEEIKTALAGNICRCTGYAAIMRAVKKAAAVMAKHGI